MRELTFRGFLTEYVRSLSYANSTSVQRLAKEAAEENPRLREPLLLYAVFSGKPELLVQASMKYGMDPQYTALLSQYNASSMEEALNAGNVLPEEYTKVWKSYQSRKNRLVADNHTKELMRQRVRKLQDQHGITNYRIYTELGLNPGNLNAWLKHGDSNKVSLETARSVLQFTKQYSQV